jgi:condensin complex subunit 2
MSQKFDEGGAKGLLLVNLGVAGDGCRIILDSKEDNVIPNETDDDNQDEDVAGDEAATETETETGSTEEVVQEEGLIDISEVRIKLQELLLCTPLDTVQLVPQLEELRESYAALEEEGFTDNRIVQKVTVSSTKTIVYWNIENRFFPQIVLFFRNE